MMRLRAVFIAPVLAIGALTTASVAAPPGEIPVAAASTCPAPGGVTVPDATASGTGFVVQGHGWGHSLGMSQYGAQGAARLGCTHGQILAAYYQGTHLVDRSMTAPVILSLAGGVGSATVLAESTGVTWRNPRLQSTGGISQPAGQTWSVRRQSVNGTAVVALLDQSGIRRGYVAGTDTLEAAHAGVTIELRTSGVDQRLRQGNALFQLSGSGLGVQERIDTDSAGTAVDRYLWGLGEVPVSWPAEALRAQADAARTYLSGSYRSSVGGYLIGTTTAAQVYAGADREDVDARYGGAWHSAVDATSSELIVDGSGAVISAMYASSDGGHSEDRGYVYGSQGGYGYLTGIDDSRWDLASDNPYRSWAVTFSPSDFARRLGFSSVSSASIGAPGTALRDAGLRVTGIVAGRSSTQYYTGSQVRYLLGLRSAGITVSFRSAPAAQSSRTGSGYGLSPRSVGLFGVLTSGGGSGRVEVHSMPNGYSVWRRHVATAFGTVTTADWAFFVGPTGRDGAADLIGVHLRNTSSGRVEVHVLSAASDYTRFLGHRVTALPALDPSRWQLLVGPVGGDGRADLVAVGTDGTGTGRVEAHVLTEASGYRSFLFHGITPLAAGSSVAGEWQFLLGPGGNLVGVHHQGTTTGRVEVHVLSAASRYAGWNLHRATPLAVTDSQWQFLLGDQNGDGTPDLFALRVAGGGSGQVEVHVLSGAAGFGSWLLHRATPLAAPAPAAWEWAVA